MRINLVSPPFSCGVAWLANLLLALDVRATNAGHADHWQCNSGEWTIGATAESHLKWHLPVLHQRNKFRFREPVEVVWEHRLDFAEGPACPTILFVRDPRDAVHSLYRRQYEMHFTFPEYLARPDIWPDHFPKLFRLPPLETFSYYVSFWLTMAARAPLLLVRFEDAKSRPIETATRILDFIGIHRAIDEIERAIESSSFDNARQAMLSTARETGRKFLTARRGQPGEWRESYDEAALAFVTGPVIEILERLGYQKAGLAMIGEADMRRDENLDTLLRNCFAGATLRVARETAMACIDGRALPLASIARSIADDTSETGETRHALAALVLAAEYVESIFTNDDAQSQEAKRLSLATFYRLNLRHLSHLPVRCNVRTTLHYLKTMSAATL
ncbi:MAG: sulfotransferase domain-containing protein [Candidatus Accumulibacter sp.]|uniref:sulfotransferase domain-containing protein n=1 Tax=Accumulibacter sp. TaxID=2053492 RepID=UPI002878D8C9|nr:sulfotransferase domain-containing protein [Accumulibacter sp.]MDS4013424.1 sulfotransferase domain-containing protein [Accumulibacter sp.]